MGFDRRSVIDSPTGSALNVYVRTAPGPGRAVLQINHGLAEHAARYARFSDFLAGHGIHSVAHDHRGHGFTRAPGAPPGRFAEENGADKVIADALAVHEAIASDFPGLPVIVFGHSMGSLIAAHVLLRISDRLRAAALWNGNHTAGLVGRAALALLAWERFRLGSDMPSCILPKLTFRAWGKAVPGHRTPFDWLSRDQVEVAAYIADPLCGWDASVSMWTDLFRLAFEVNDETRLATVRRDLPFNLVGGERDPATSGGKAVLAFGARLRRLGFSDVSTTIYPETRHESLNEVNRETVMADFATWLDRVLL